jgi:hypothetical protein
MIRKRNPWKAPFSSWIKPDGGDWQEVDGLASRKVLRRQLARHLVSIGGSGICVVLRHDQKPTDVGVEVERYEEGKIGKEDQDDARAR